MLTQLRHVCQATLVILIVAAVEPTPIHESGELRASDVARSEHDEALWTSSRQALIDDVRRGVAEVMVPRAGQVVVTENHLLKLVNEEEL
jgi:hypothetical protein